MLLDKWPLWAGRSSNPCFSSEVVAISFVLTFREMAHLCLSLLITRSWGSWKASVTAFPMAFRSVLGAVQSGSDTEEVLLGFVQTSLCFLPLFPPPALALNSQILVATVLFLLLISPENKVAVATDRLFPFFFLPSSYPSLDLSGLWRHVCSFQLP